MRALCIFLAVVILAGCGEKPGQGILEEHKMLNVMWDLMQADEFATTYVSRDTTRDLKTERFKLYKDVYRINGLDEKTFSESYTYYTAHPDLMKKIFDSLTTKAEKERQRLYQPDTSAARLTAVADSLKTDSIRKASRVTDSIRLDSMKQSPRPSDSLKKLRRGPDTLQTAAGKDAGRSRQMFLLDSLRKARMRKTQKP